MIKILVPSDISLSLWGWVGKKKNQKHMLLKAKLHLIPFPQGEAEKEDWTQLEDLLL